MAGGVDGELIELAPGVHVWRQTPSGHGRTNAGVVVDDDGITMVDTLLSPVHAQPLVDLLTPLGLPVRRAVYSSSHIEFTGGSPAFWMAARYGRSQTSALLDSPPNPAALQALHPDFAELLADPATRPVSHVTDVPAWLSPRVCVVPTAGQQLENLVVVVPDADVAFAGAMCCFGTTPNCFDGDPERWADALGDLDDLATRVVPGIGPVGGADDVVALQAYLWSVVEAAETDGAIPAGPWDAWTDRHLDEVNVERARMLAAGDRSVPPSMLRLIGLA